jgi:hypothetical protein
MTNWFMTRLAGVTKLVQAIIESTGVADAFKLISTNSYGKLHESFLPDGIGADIKIAPSSENLVAGNEVNIWDDTGTLKVRKADAAGGIAKRAHGFVKENVTAPANATVYFNGFNTEVSGLTPGATYYLSDTPGGISTTAPDPDTDDGYIIQEVGVATASGELFQEYGEPVLIEAT